jgi:hypothetical protein
MIQERVCSCRVTAGQPAGYGDGSSTQRKASDEKGVKPPPLCSRHGFLSLPSRIQRLTGASISSLQTPQDPSPVPIPPTALPLRLHPPSPATIAPSRRLLSHPRPPQHSNTTDRAAAFVDSATPGYCHATPTPDKAKTLYFISIT